MEFAQYMAGVAEARFAIRKVFRIVDEQARAEGLDPLQHQMLLQVCGAPGEVLRVNHVAERLDIAPAFASRMVRRLEELGHVRRATSAEDRRVTEIHLTDAGRELLRRIDRDVRIHVEYFQRQLSQDSKGTALSIMAFYIGLDVSPEVIEQILEDSKDS